jgi:hypothetical protein
MPKYDAPFEAQFDEGRAQDFIIRSLIARVHTATPVKVLAVYPLDDFAGTVDVQPLILEQDTNGVAIPQSPAYGLPYLRLQGGTSAVIIDPVVGDIGIGIFGERDTSNVVRTRGEGPAPTARTHSSADGFYLGGFLNGAPTQWVKFIASGGIDIHTPGNLGLNAGGNLNLFAGGNLSVMVTGNATLSAASWNITGPITSNDPITAPDITLPRGSVNDHVHPVTSAPGTTGNYTG